MRKFMLQRTNSSAASSLTTTTTGGSMPRKKPAWITRIQNRKKESSSSSDEASNRRPQQIMASLELQPRGGHQGLKIQKPTNVPANPRANSLQAKPNHQIDSSQLLSSQQKNNKNPERAGHKRPNGMLEPLKSASRPSFPVQCNTMRSTSSPSENDTWLLSSLSPSLSIRSNAKGYSSPFQRGEQLELRSTSKSKRDPSQKMTITVSMVQPNRNSSTSTSGAGSTISPIKLSSKDDSSSTGSKSMFKVRTKKKWRPSSVHVSSSKFNNYFQLDGGGFSSSEKVKVASKSESNFYDLFERTRDSRLLAHSSETLSGTVMNSMEYGDGDRKAVRSYFNDTPSSPEANLDFDEHFRLTKDFGDFQTYSESPLQRLQYSNIPRTPGSNVEDQRPTTAVPLGNALLLSSSLHNENQRTSSSSSSSTSTSTTAGSSSAHMDSPGKSRKSNAKFNERKTIRKETRI